MLSYIIELRIDSELNFTQLCQYGYNNLNKTVPSAYMCNSLESGHNDCSNSIDIFVVVTVTETSKVVMAIKVMSLM